MLSQRTPAEAGEVPRPALSEYGRWFRTTAYLLEFGESEAIDRSRPSLPEEFSPYGPCLDHIIDEERDVARFVCHFLGLRCTSAQGATPESAPLVDWVFPLGEGVSLSTLPPEFIYTLFPLHRRTLFQPTLGARGLGSSGVALNWRVLPSYFQMLGRVLGSEEAAADHSERPIDCGLSAALSAVVEEEAGDVPPAVVFCSGLRHVADFH